jgi:MFS transporter, PAT family, beta-lactamase induction signal transducer AmpG
MGPTRGNIAAMTPTPWRWIPTLYLGQGLPYVAVMTLAVVMYKNLGVGNAEIALVTSWLYLPWVIKPLWSPLVDLLGRKRGWIVALQLLVGAAFAGVALVVPVPSFLQWTLVMFWLLAFASATHDIAADGFYILALDRRRQAAFVGVRSTFYRISMLGGQGGLVWLAGWWAQHHGGPVAGWQAVFGLLALAFGVLAMWHAWALPRPAADGPAPMQGDFWRGFMAVFRSFFARDDIVRVLVFLLVYRLGEAQLLKLVLPFLLDARADGGLAFTTQDVGLAYGTVGVAALTLGGLLGGWAISRAGLGRLLPVLLLAMNVPNLLYVWLAWAQPEGFALVAAALAVEQFGYGFGFTAYMVFMLWVAGGRDGGSLHKTAHYAICTGFMALGMMLPGMAAGWLQEQMGYTSFFIWCCVATLPGFAAAAWARIPRDFGREEAPRSP